MDMPTPKRWLYLILISCGLAACATATTGTQKIAQSGQSPTNAEIPIEGNQLAPQTLRAGECGLFGWDPEARFVFFATPRRGAYLAEGQRRSLQPSGEFPNLRFDTIDVALGRVEDLDDGKRYPEARLQEVLPDGFTRVLPLRVVETCTMPAQSL